MTRVAMPKGLRKPHETLIHAHIAGPLESRGGSYITEIPRANIRMPMYKINDSDDLHLMELISPSHELHRKLIEGRRPMTPQQHTPVILLSPNKTLDGTSIRTKHKQTALKNLQMPISRKLNARLFGGDVARLMTVAPPAPKNFVPDNRRGAQKKSPKKQSNLKRIADQSQFADHAQTFAEQMHHYPLDFEDVRIYNSELLTGRERVTKGSELLTDQDRAKAGSGFLSERRVQLKLLTNAEQKASDLRLISKLWHQDCKSSITIQQRLSYLLNSKLKEAFEDGRVYTYEKCKHNDFKAEVGQILKNLERAGAPQLLTLNVKYELAVACVNEVFGKGMGEEYMKLEMYFMQASSGSSALPFINMTRDESHVEEIVERVQCEYVDVQNIMGFMLDQLSLFESSRAAD